ncbi:MAG: Gfo/Idh/MocA family oxidoreductase [Kiritimatiellae bacterium]|nr:Gfo/Idh/MocA family oxidoreductase [Kiritimatiellia bacterium]
MAKKIRVAFIGTGGISRKHLQCITDFKDTEVAGLCDVNPDVLKERQQAFGGETFADPEKMLDTVCPDAAVLCLPPFAHGPAEMACIKRNIPFLLEKPVEKDLAAARKIAREVAKRKLITSVAYQRRYDKRIQAARKIVGDYPLTLVYGGWLGRTPHGHRWLTQKKLSGGQMIEQTTHMFDLLRFLAGDAKGVFCYGAKGFIEKSKLYNTDDATSAVIQMKSGAVATIMSSWSSTGLGVTLTFSGPGITVQCGGDCQVQLAGKEEPEKLPESGNVNEAQERAFIDAVKTGDRSPIMCDYADGVKSLQISAAANESLETGKPVAIR